MVHFVFLYYIAALSIGWAGVLVSASFYIKMQEKFIKDYLLFFAIFGIKIVEIAAMFYIYSNVSSNLKAVEIAYTISAVITFMFYTAMLTLINESFDVPYKKLKNYAVFAVTLLLMVVGMGSYKADVNSQLLYITDTFYLVNIYCVAAVIYVVYNGIKYRDNIENLIQKKVNSIVIKLFLICSPFTLLDSIKIAGGKSFKLGENFSLVYFLPLVFAVFTAVFSIKLVKTYSALESIKDENEKREELYEIESIDDECAEKYKISAREKEVIINLLKGKSNKEIADTMEISANTVKSHLNNIYGKIGARNRYELFNIVKPKNR